MIPFPRIEHLLVNIVLLLLVGLPLEMTHGGGRVALVFVPGFHLIFLNILFIGFTNIIIKFHRLILGLIIRSCLPLTWQVDQSDLSAGVLAASLLYSVSKPCGSLVGFTSMQKVGY